MKDIHVIAEAGSNNNGQISKAKSLVDIAKRAGADSVKFQMINTWGLYLPGQYEYGNYNIDDVIRIRQEGEMTDAEYRELDEYARSVGIPFTSSIFDSDGLELYSSFDPPYIKLASCDLNNIKLLREVARKDIRIIISTGMSSMDDVKRAVRTLEDAGASSIVILHCVSIYPASLQETNLHFIQELQSNFPQHEIGFSDHTPTSHAACVALSLGATWFEKHFTEDKSQEGLDHKHALDEDELREYVSDLRAVAYSLEPKEMKITDAEKYTRRRARRALYASRDLPTGHVIQEEDVLVVRPEGPMRADEYDDLIGAQLKAPLSKYDPFEKENVG